MIILSISHLLVLGGIIATASIGLMLHLRLVRFFDLSWAVWSMVSAIGAVFIVQRSSSILFGILIGAIFGGILGALEDGMILRKILLSYIPADVMERYTFTGALALFLTIISMTEVLGFREQEMIPASKLTSLKIPQSDLIVICACWGILLIFTLLRRLPIGLQFRALIDNPQAFQQFGFSVQKTSFYLGLSAGLLTGIASSSFGVIYQAHYSSGLTIMLLAVIPCIVVGLRSSLRVLIASIFFVIVLVFTRYKFGYVISEFFINSAFILLIIIFPSGLVGKRLREV